MTKEIFSVIIAVWVRGGNFCTAAINMQDEKEESMKKMSLNGAWQMQVLGDNVYGISQEPIPAQIPGSVYGNLLEQGLMPDPFYRINELDALKLMENDFRFVTTFTLTQEQIESDFLLLHFDGVDTLEGRRE